MNTKIVQTLRSSRLLRDTRGANMVEYIILVGMVALLCVMAFSKFGGAVTNKIGEQQGAVEGINGKGQ